MSICKMTSAYTFRFCYDNKECVGDKTKYGVMPNLHVLDVWPTQIGTNSTLLEAFILEDGGFKVARFEVYLLV